MRAKRQKPNEDLRKFWISFWMYAVGEFLVYSAYGSLINLQSSINVVGGLDFYTMIPASIIVSAGESILWGCIAVMNSFYAKQFSMQFGTSEANYESKLSGYFFAVFQMSKITGNLISYSVLYAFNMKEAINNTNILHNESFSNPNTYDNLNYCGANDCQNASILSNAIEQYVPANKVTIYVLIGVMVLMCFAAVAMHAIFIPNIEEHITQTKSNDKELKDTKETGRQISSKLSNGAALDEAQNETINHEMDSAEHQDNLLSANETIQVEASQAEAKYKKSSYISIGIKILRDVGMQLINTKQLLLTPILLYIGLGFGFVTSEITRSYSACVFGVAWIPIHYVFYGIAASLMSYVVGKLCKHISRNVFLAIATIVDSCMYIYVLFWTPYQATHASLIFVYFLLGGVNAIWVTITQVVEMNYFPDCLDTASPVWSMWYTVGIGAQFAWSTSVCVRTKIYTQLAMLGFSMICYGIADKFLYTSQSSRIAEEKKESDLGLICKRVL